MTLKNNFIAVLLIELLFPFNRLIAQNDIWTYSPADFPIMTEVHSIYRTDSMCFQIQVNTHDLTFLSNHQAEIHIDLQVYDKFSFKKPTFTQQWKQIVNSNDEHALRNIALPFHVAFIRIEILDLASNKKGIYMGFVSQPIVPFDILDEQKSKLVGWITVGQQLNIENQKVWVAKKTEKNVAELPYLIKKNPVTTEKNIFYPAKNPFIASETGVYRFQKNEHDSVVFSIPAFLMGYPDLLTLSQKIDPLVYITTPNEYKILQKLDENEDYLNFFWSDFGGSKERCEIVREEFYNRVSYANRFFYEQSEGWRSDKGMCLIIFGLPDKIIWKEMQETWTYLYRPGGTEHLILHFKHQLNEGQWKAHLYRNSDLLPAWKDATDFWRNGLIQEN